MFVNILIGSQIVPLKNYFCGITWQWFVTSINQRQSHGKGKGRIWALISARETKRLPSLQSCA